MRRLTLLSFLLASGGCRTAPAEPAGTQWPVPGGWKSETFRFPLEFAPDIPLTGVEELRFAPGFFDPSKPGYWSYDFVWLVELPGPPEHAQLEDWLKRYFSGLCQAVGGKKFAFRPERFAAHLDEAVAEAGVRTWRGSVQTYDPFATGGELTLQVKIEDRGCEGSSKRALLFRLSPRPDTADLWKELDALARTFRCAG